MGIDLLDIFFRLERVFGVKLTRQDLMNLICCYNARRNDPYKESHHPRYTPLEKVDDPMICKVGVKRFADSGDVAWLDPVEDQSSRTLAREFQD